jgi:Flp pilus assembly protein TadB
MDWKQGKWATAAAAALLASACAQQPAKVADADQNADKATVAQTEQKSDRVCRSHHAVGTHFRKTRCMSREQAELEREQSIDAMERAKQSSMSGAIKTEGMTGGPP